ncbi:MAG: molybdenum cofactor synthesis domain-containing protein [Candidatus Nanopelagicales bacterium]|jgi:molybdenum cofactor synthesis domain-containing protein
MSAFKAQVITVSTRGAAGTRPDTSGEIIFAALEAGGFDVSPTVVIPDGPDVTSALRTAIDAGHDLVITTGGTGLTPTDFTPEMTIPVIDREIPGIADAIRAFGLSNGIPTAALSRGIAGQSGKSLVVNAPGSPGGAKDAMAVLMPIVIHALEQISGSDH